MTPPKRCLQFVADLNAWVDQVTGTVHFQVLPSHKSLRSRYCPFQLLQSVSKCRMYIFHQSTHLSNSGARIKDFDDNRPTPGLASVEEVSRASANLTGKFEMFVSNNLGECQPAGSPLDMASTDLNLIFLLAPPTFTQGFFRRPRIWGI